MDAETQKKLYMQATSPAALARQEEAGKETLTCCWRPKHKGHSTLCPKNPDRPKTA